MERVETGNEMGAHKYIGGNDEGGRRRCVMQGHGPILAAAFTDVTAVLPCSSSPRHCSIQGSFQHACDGIL